MFLGDQPLNHGIPKSHQALHAVVVVLVEPVVAAQVGVGLQDIGDDVLHVEGQQWACKERIKGNKWPWDLATILTLGSNGI